MVRACTLLAALALAGCGGGGDRSSSEPERRDTLVWAVGDAADAGLAGRPLSQLVRDNDPARFLYMGDVYETGTREEFEEYYEPLYGDLASRTSFIVGNHENANRRDGFDPYWKSKTGRIPPQWYTLRVRGWELIALNTEAPHDSRSAQVRWLRRHLRDAPATTCRIALWHRPRYSAGEHHGDQTDVAPLWEAVIGHAVAVVSGHEHDLQRLEEQDGLVQFISGGGGRELHPIDESDDRLAFGDDERYGGLRLKLREGSFDYEFVADDGDVLDEGTLRCEP